MFVDAPGASPRDSSGPEPVDRLPLAAIERQIGELAAHINAATCRWLTLVAEFDRRAGQQAFGFVSCASWLAWKCSVNARAAREQVRVARCLAELPRIRAAFASGALSYSKVRALTRVAEPAMEQELVELALEATAEQLERLMRGYRRALAPDVRAQAAERRHLSTRWEDDGTLTIRANISAEEGAVFLQGLQVARERLRDGTEAAAERGDPQSSSGEEVDRPDGADALVALAESAVAEGVSPASGGERHQVVVHVDADALGSTVQTAGGEVGEGVPIAAETVRRLACDASIVALVERDGKPLSVGRRTRSIPPSIARALRTRDRGCRFPGCGRRTFVDAHHVRHWAHGGETSLDNLVQLCRHHHRLVHEGGFSVSSGPRGIEFRRPSGRVIEAVPRPPAGSLVGCMSAGGRAGAWIDQHTCSPRSAGAPMDLDLGVFALAALQERRRATADDSDATKVAAARAGP